MKSFVGTTVEAITLSGFDGTHTECLTDNYLKLRLLGRHVANRWTGALVESVQGGTLVATGAYLNSSASSCGLSTTTSGGAMFSVCGAKP